MNLFDTGKVWLQWENTADNKLVEQRHAGIISYRATKENRQKDPRFFAKQSVEQILANNHITASITYKQTTNSYFHLNKQCDIYIWETRVWYMGEVHPRIAESLKLPSESCTTYAALNLDTLPVLISHAHSGTYETLQDQIIWRDFSFVMDISQTRQTISDILATIPDVRDTRIFDVYWWENLPEGKKSIAFSCKMQWDGNMTSEQINEVMQRIIKAVETTWATLR